jgi:hypothetical protein
VSVCAEWSKDHVSAIGALYTHCFWSLMLDKIETGQCHLGGPVEHLEGKGGESVVPILRFLYGSFCLCRLRTEGLIPVSKY